MPITGGHVESRSTSRPGSAPGSRVKFLCSHGGKILPCPADGHLKYIGGETRVICVLRDITFPELMKKLTSMFNGEMILKYQLMPEDLDVLVTVKSDEDIRHMIDECDRHEYPRLRAFLFPANPMVTVNHLGPMDHHSLEQRYINSINGIPNPVRPLPGNTSHTTFSISSACSSPRTPPETTTTAATAAGGINTEFIACQGKSSSLTRTRSSPSLCNLGCSSVTNHLNPIATASPNLSQNHHQQPPPLHHFHLQPHQTPKPPLDRHPHKTPGPEHIGRMRSTGLAEYYRQQMDHTPSHSHRTNKGGHMYYQRGSPYDAYYGNFGTESPPSPDVPSSSPGSRLGR